MKKTYKTMGMTAVIEICEAKVVESDIDEIFSYFDIIDDIFSTFKKTSIISKLNSGEINYEKLPTEVLKILKLSEIAKKQTRGYFDINKNGKIDPSGLVKGYAIEKASKMLLKKGYKNFYIEIGSDFAIKGLKNNEKWKIGIRNPFKTGEVVKVLCVTNCGVATSGNYLKKHIYNPTDEKIKNRVVSLTVVGPNIFDADKMSTAAFAMGENGLIFIENLKNYEGYMITDDKKAHFTNGFEKYVCN